MSLYKRKNSEIWWVSVSVPGHPKLRRSTGELDRFAAQRIHDELKASLWKIDPALKGKTWGKAVEKWVAVETRSDSELLSLQKFARGYKDRPLSAVTAESIDDALAFCKTAGTYTRYRTMIAAILNLSKIKLELVSRKDKKKKSRDWITPEQWAVLYPELPEHLKPMAAFALATGLRRANVLGLTWARCDLERKMVWVEGEDTKAGHAISVPLSDQAFAVLTTLVGQHPEYVFTYRGKPIRTVKTAFQAACIRAKLGKRDGKGYYSGFTWHGFRHTWATWHSQRGTPSDVLQHLGGWSDPRMVANYTHHAPGHLAGFANNSRSKS